MSVTVHHTCPNSDSSVLGAVEIIKFDNLEYKNDSDVIFKQWALSAAPCGSDISDLCSFFSMILIIIFYFWPEILGDRYSLNLGKLKKYNNCDKVSLPMFLFTFSR